MPMDYSQTLNLPKTDFPMRGGLPEKEPAMIDGWKKADIYKKRLDRNRHSGKKFVLHDGPPYANGGIHLGTALNKVLKDIIVRYYDMAGHFAPYVPGWDTRPAGAEGHQGARPQAPQGRPVVFRQACSDIAMKYLDVQREAFKRLGVVGDWDDPYITLLPQFEARQIEVFRRDGQGRLHLQGCGPCTGAPAAKPRWRKPRSSTWKAQPVDLCEVPGPGGWRKSWPRSPAASNTVIMIWTTTTWTLPGNMAISVDPEYRLCRRRYGPRRSSSPRSWPSRS